jgi:hypothetical protein
MSTAGPSLLTPVLLGLAAVAGCSTLPAQGDRGDEPTGGAALIGTWRAAPRAGVPADPDDQVQFGDDGTFVLGRATPDRVVSGTYEADDDTVLVTGVGEGGEALRELFNYSVGPSGLVLYAALPSGPHVDVVGTWTTRWYLQELDEDGGVVHGTGGEQTFVIEEDGRLRYSTDRYDGGSDAGVGYYRPTSDGGAYETVFDDGLQYDWSFALVDDAALTGVVYERP